VTVFSQKNLRLLWLAQFVSVAGDFLFLSSVLFLVLSIESEKGALKAGVANFLCMLPFLIFGPLAGALVDRLDRRRLMIGCDLARAVLLFSVPWLHAAGWLNWLSLGALGFLLSSFSALFNPARDALLPEIAGETSLLKANAAIQTSFQLAMIAGTLCAGALLQFQKTAGMAPIDSILRLFRLDAGSFLVSAALLAALRVTPVKLERNSDSVWRNAGDGLLYLAKSPLLAPLLVLTAIDNFFIMGPATVGANLLIKRTLARGADAVAWFEAALALGWFAGSLAIIRVGSHWPKGRLLLVGVLMDGVTFIPMIALNNLPSWPLALALIFIHGLFIPAITVARSALVHEAVPRALQGRVFSMVNLTVVGSMSLSNLATGALGEVVSPPMLYLIAGSGGTLCGILGFLLCRTLRRQA
jgi:MFS transporter, DHA3 family, macrolide efflux protein